MAAPSDRGGDGRQTSSIAIPSTDSAILQFIEDVTRDAAILQKELLFEILRRNHATEYLAALGLDGSSDDYELFKRVAPPVTYEDIQPFIKRIANGDKSPILCSQPITRFLTSSGTSRGERKLIPTTAEELDRKRNYHRLVTPVMRQYVDGLEKGKHVRFLFVRSESRTPAGLSAMPALTTMFRSPQFRRMAKTSEYSLTSPVEAIVCDDVFQSMYCQLLCSLINRNKVFSVGAAFPSIILRVIRFLEEKWPQFLHDIREKKLRGYMVTDVALRDATEEILAANSEEGGEGQAELLEKAYESCQKNGGKDLIKRLWPCAKYVEVIVTGTMVQYVPMLQFYAGGLPLVSTIYGCSECYCALNLRPLSSPSSISYTFIPTMAYFEFLPIHSEPSSASLVDLVNVEVGKEYEVVVTTDTGLYRYRIGDVLRVTGFHNSSPEFQIVGRTNVLISIDTDKTDEETLLRAVQIAISKKLDGTGFRLVDFTSMADLSTIPGHYVLFWELTSFSNIGQSRSSCTPEASVMEECCLEMEESLDTVYRQGRVCEKCIGPLEIRIVSPGTFDALMDCCYAAGSSMDQYKTPRCVNSEALIHLLNSRVSHSFFSPKCPVWSP